MFLFIIIILICFRVAIFHSQSEQIVVLSIYEMMILIDCIFTYTWSVVYICWSSYLICYIFFTNKLFDELN
jgi:hypothetical protein